MVKLCPSVGEPPILVLSYKNHAINEFLLDLVKAEPFVSMIRLGNDKSEVKLLPYQERNFSQNLPGVVFSKQELIKSHKSLEMYSDFYRSVKSVFFDRSVFLDFDQDPKSAEAQRQKCYNAVSILLKAIVWLDSIIAEPVVSQNTEESSVPLIGNLPLHEPRFIQKLHSHVKHYKFPGGNQEILFKFLTDFVPQPHCMYPFEECETIVHQGYVFCVNHTCSYGHEEYSDAAPCRNNIEENRLFCQMHVSAVGECEFSRIQLSKQSFCELHACKICVENGLVAKKALMEPPRNTCEDHVICSKSNDFGPCTNLALPNETICEEHVPTGCIRITKRGKKCVGMALSKSIPYCRNHRESRPSPPLLVVEQIVPTSICQGTTTKGKNCKSKAIEGSQFCDNHRNQESILPDVVEAVPNFPDVPEIVRNVDDVVMGVNSTESDADSVSSKNSDVLSDLEIIPTDNMDEFEMNDNLQHLRDVLGSEDIDELMADYEIEEINDNNTPDLKNDFEDYQKDFVDPAEWSWSMPYEERVSVCTALMKMVEQRYFVVRQKLQQEFKSRRIRYNDENVRSKSRVFEGKAVIAGTIVGAISRLDAIRYVNPFAIIVEEASEVVEPLIFGCLGSSTRKLEMVGDHMQLHPCVTSKFEFEKMNKINISLFERLITCPSNSQVPHDVLSIQRRMRKEICDLTRNYYQNITKIKDDPFCEQRLIAHNQSRGLIRSCDGSGKLVPGIVPPVFFWTHQGRQRNATVGLSKVNHIECDLVCKLAKYLVDTGVPKQSIAILTPYKGQLMIIRNKLKSSQFGLLPLSYNGIGHSNDYCRVSTVDRFQGDEADVIIASLVIDGNSKTPFVKQLNRMIVLLSRARIGFYLIGNAEYFERNPVEHWQNTIKLLQEGDEDADSQVSRIGPDLVLCCPQHRCNTKVATKAEDVILGFCKEKCHHVLSCSHECGRNCHFGDKVHSSPCDFPVPSPCDHHQQLMPCYEIFLNSQMAYGLIENALKVFECAIRVQFTLPCGHVIDSTCGKVKKYVSKELRYPICKKPSIQSFTYPDCKHELSGECHLISDFLQSIKKPPVCMNDSTYIPACGHSVSVQCFRKQEYVINPLIFNCVKKIKRRLPRCKHFKDLACSNATSLESWTGKGCDMEGVLYQGTNYGPVDSICTKKALLINSCGHEESLPCEDAFMKFKSSHRCSELVTTTNPTCGHELKAVCSDLSEIGRLNTKWINGQMVLNVNEGDSTVFVSTPFGSSCSSVVTVRYSCGHSEIVACKQAQNIKPNCKELVVVKNPICYHEVKVPCKDKDFGGYKPWTEDNMKQQCVQEYLDASVITEKFVIPDSIPDKYKSVLLSCSEAVMIQRQLTCCHQSKNRCGDVLKKLLSSKDGILKLDSCQVEVSNPLKCGHLVSMSCAKYDKYTKNPSLIKCNQIKEQKCWNHKQCSSVIKLPCSVNDTPSCEKIITWYCGNGHEFKLSVCKDGIPDNCPDCNIDAIEKKVGEFEALKKTVTKTFSDVVPSSYHTLLKQVGTGCSYTQGEISEFIDKIILSLRNFQSWVESKDDEWSVPMFQPHAIPVFTVLKNANDKNLKHLNNSSSNLNSAIVFEWTIESLKALEKQIKGDSEIHIQFGFGFVCRLLRNPKDVPKKALIKGGRHKQKKRDLQMAIESFDSVVATWVDDCASAGFDAFSLSDKHSIGFFDPYSIYLPWKLSMSKQTLSSNLRWLSENAVDITWGDKFICFSKPNSESKPNSAQESQQATFLLSKYGCDVDFSWDCKSLFVVHPISLTVEKELSSKLKFIYHKNDDIGCFGGILFMEKITRDSLTDIAELKLVKCLELQSYGQSYFQEADTSLNQYIDSVKVYSSKFHPLTLLAMARSQSNTLEERKHFVGLFSGLFPAAMQKWLSSMEQEWMGICTTTEEGTLSSHLNFKLTKAKTVSLSDQWQNMKLQHNASSDAMDELMGLIGLDKVKSAAIGIYKSSIAFNKMSEKDQNANSLQLNYVFSGNPGSGKTTTARLFAQILKDCGLRESYTFVECTAQELKDDGTDNFRKKIKGANNGVLFIDEAYDLDPVGDFKGKPIVSELLTVSENNRKSLSIILAGYADDMEKKLYAYNVGLRSRFQEIVFEDFDSVDLLKIWNLELAKRGWSADENVGEVLVRRLSKFANTKGFGNARAIRQKVEDATKRAFARPDFDGKMVFLLEDVIGESPLKNQKLKEVLDEVDSKIGWATIKAAIKTLVSLCEKNYDLELKGQPTLPVQLNRLLLGSPGTGKTTFASFYGRILKCLGFLSNGEVIIKTASDFMGQYAGSSQTKTNEILTLSKGKVLVIDESYNLDDNLYGKQVLDCLVEKVQGTEADDIAVLLLGYEKPMLDMLRNQNQGLARRFPRNYAFMFEDYNDADLLKIFDASCQKLNVRVSSFKVQQKAISILNKQKAFSNFGNAGAVNTLLRAAIANACERNNSYDNDGKLCLQPSDLEGNERLTDQDPFEPLDKLYRMDNVKKELMSLRDIFKLAEAEGAKFPKIGHFVYRGNPGTGKTTVARVTAQIMFQLGILTVNKVVETSGLGLTGEFVGQTKTKVTAKLKEADGGILFIDEAYAMATSIHYGEEAITTLVEAMTSEEFKSVVIIIAGYSKQIDDMLQVNPGLKSRFTRYLDFQDWTSSDCIKYVQDAASKDHFRFEADAISSLDAGFSRLITLDGWGNGRDVNQLWKNIQETRASRLSAAQISTVKKIITFDDVSISMNKMVQAREPSASSPSFHRHETPNPQFSTDSRSSRNKEAPKHEFQNDESEESDDSNDAEEEYLRDPGVDEEIWKDVCNARKEYERQQEELKRAIQEAKDEEERKRLEREKQLEIERKAKIQEKLRQLVPCPVGFQWYKCASGWRCGGGGHYVSDETLQKQFMI